MDSYLSQPNIAYIEDMRKRYEADPTLMEPTWRAFFDGIVFSEEEGISTQDLTFEFKVLELVQTYRQLGYLSADVNPLDRTPHVHPLLTLERFGLAEADLGRTMQIAAVLGLSATTLGEVVASMRAAYCAPVAVEFEHIEDSAIREWIQQRIESHALTQPLDAFWKRRTLEKLTETEALETFIHKRFVAQKRFSLEGDDAMIPMLDYLVNLAVGYRCDEIIIGMAHRGRLNVLGNIFGRDMKQLFAEFSGNLQTFASPGDGDVKYHIGYSCDKTTLGGQPIHLALSSNPSHLEAINPVVMGITRSKQQMKGDKDRVTTLALLFHGDAAFAGQGSIYETLNMSELEGYAIGGAFHIVINNQIGFTTMPWEGRSTPNATDVAKMLESPIFRVNADEPEACMRAVEMALEFRYTFKRDVFIDLMGYRRYGHNEGDEPAFTQPQMYRQIESHPRVRSLYARQLLDEGLVDEAAAAQLLDEKLAAYENDLTESRKAKVVREQMAFEKKWSRYHPIADEAEVFRTVDTGVAARRLASIGEQLIAPPAGFNVHPKIGRLLGDRREMIDGARPLDWAVAEELAFGSLIMDGFMVRLAGQDCKRGTFSHRHAVFTDTETGEKYAPLNHLQDARADFEVVNSLLSEFAALGFEFGQSLANPDKLTIWEAQFGDFANGAQVIIDQFVVSSAAKWQRYSGLVMLLPHGYEGQGPEHSSARIERYLQACAQNNIQVCNLTTPAQYFHVLRRQMLHTFRVPLIVISPKSLLRHPRAVSTLKDLADGVFEEFLDETDATNNAERVVLCTGKIYYELLQRREEQGLDVPLVRVEQLYPFAKEKMAKILARHTAAKRIVWCQEEPRNMGSWTFIQEQLLPLLDPKQQLDYVGRPPQASPSGGYLHVHEAEQRQIVTEALGVSA